MAGVTHGSMQAGQLERLAESKDRSANDAADVLALAKRAGLSLRKSGGLTMTGLLASASHSRHDEWMHWMLKDQGRSLRGCVSKTSVRFNETLVLCTSTPSTLSSSSAAQGVWNASHCATPFSLSLPTPVQFR